MSKTSFRVYGDGEVVHQDDYAEHDNPFQAEDFEQFLIDDTISVMEFENPDDPSDCGWCWCCNSCGAHGDYLGKAEKHRCDQDTLDEVEKWKDHYSQPEPEDPNFFISVYMPIAGWKAIMYGRDPDCDGMFVPWETADIAFKTKAEAEDHAQSWAKNEGLRYEPSDEPDVDASDKSVTEQLQELIPGIKVVTMK
jgi:hypothetical protein